MTPATTNRQRTFLSLLLLALGWTALDQALKLYTLEYVPAYPSRLEVVPGVLAFTYAQNRGAAWGILDGGVLPLTLVRAAAGVLILAYVWRRPNLPRLHGVAFALIAGGAWGNAYDGVTRGFVVDTLLSHTLSALHRPLFGTGFPIFNLADVGIVTGVGLLLLASLFEGFRRREDTAEPDTLGAPPAEEVRGPE